MAAAAAWPPLGSQRGGILRSGALRSRKESDAFAVGWMTGQAQPAFITIALGHVSLVANPKAHQGTHRPCLEQDLVAMALTQLPKLMRKHPDAEVFAPAGGERKRKLATRMRFARGVEIGQEAPWLFGNNSKGRRSGPGHAVCNSPRSGINGGGFSRTPPA